MQHFAPCKSSCQPACQMKKIFPANKLRYGICQRLWEVLTLLESGFWVFLAFACCPGFSFLTARIQQSNTQAGFQIFKSTSKVINLIISALCMSYIMCTSVLIVMGSRWRKKNILYTCIVLCVFYSRNSIVFVTIHLISRYVTAHNVI